MIMKRRDFFLGLSKCTLSAPFLILPDRADAIPVLAFWAARRIVTGFATRAIRRRLVGATFLTSSGSVAQASSDLLNGAIRDGIVNPAYDTIFERRYAPMASRQAGITDVIYPNPPRAAYKSNPPDAAAFAAFGYDNTPSEDLGNFLGDFEIQDSPASLRQGTYRAVIAEDIDTSEAYDTGQKVYISPQRASSGHVKFKANIDLPAGRYVLKFSNSLDEPEACIQHRRCLEGVSEPFYVERH